MNVFARASRRLAIVVALSVSVILPVATPAHAQSVWYWYWSPSNSGCWNIVAGPAYGGQVQQCDYPGASWLGQNYDPGTNIGDHYIYGGAGGNVMFAKKSGDYCNSYSGVSWGSMPFNTYLSSYYWGTRSGAFSQSYCYANGSSWGTNVSQTNPVAGGVQHFASVEGTPVYPWSSQFGSNPLLYVDNKFGVFNNTSKQAWGYLCPDLVDTGGSGQILELCGEEWDWLGKQRDPVEPAGCSPANWPMSGMPAFGAINQKFGSATTIFTTRSGSLGGSSAVQTSQTVNPAKDFSMQISKSQLQQAINLVNTACQGTSGFHLSSDIAHYRLLGVEDGLEQSTQGNSNTLYDTNGSESGLIFATLY